MRYEDYLEHHGILGQKWGVRRYQNDDGSLTPAGKDRYGDYKGAKQQSRRLNDLDRAMAYNKRDIYDASTGKERLLKKQQRLAKKGKGLNQKSIEKLAEYENTINTSKKNIEKGMKETAALLKKAQREGYTVKSSATRRNVARGKDYAGIALGTLASLPLAAVTGVMIIQTGPSVQGTSYKVKAPKQ